MKKDPDALILTRQELEIMKVVWERGAATVREVCDILRQRKPTAYTTVLTLMGILERKGALAHVRSGRAYVFRPLLPRVQAIRNQVLDVVARAFDGKPEKLVEFILDDEILGPDEFQRVRGAMEASHGYAVISPSDVGQVGGDTQRGA